MKISTFLHQLWSTMQQCGFIRDVGKIHPVVFYCWALEALNSSRNIERIKHFSSVTQSFPTFCNPMDWSTPGLHIHHQFLEFTQTHVHWVGDGIPPSHPLSSPSPPAFNLSQHQGLFQWVHSSHQVAKVLEFQLQPSNEYSGLISFRMDWLDLLAVQGTLKSLLQITAQKHQFFCAQLSL